MNIREEAALYVDSNKHKKEQHMKVTLFLYCIRAYCPLIVPPVPGS